MPKATAEFLDSITLETTDEWKSKKRLNNQYIRINCRKRNIVFLNESYFVKERYTILNRSESLGIILSKFYIKMIRCVSPCWFYEKSLEEQFFREFIFPTKFFIIIFSTNRTIDEISNPNLRNNTLFLITYLLQNKLTRFKYLSQYFSISFTNHHCLDEYIIRFCTKFFS